jgi:hypothetical protein
MPAKSIAQRRLFSIAEHAPSALYSRNKGLAKLPQQTLHDFAATKEKGLPKKVKKPHASQRVIRNHGKDND